MTVNPPSQQQPTITLEENEEVILSSFIHHTKGFFRRKQILVESRVLTNHRIFREDNINTTLQVIRLEHLDHCEVINQKRVSNSNTYGYSVRMHNVRSMNFESSGVGRVIGDLVFFANDVQDIHWPNTQDAASIKRLVKALHKTRLQELGR